MSLDRADGGQKVPHKALRGGIPSPVLEPFPRSWRHFVASCCQKFTNLVKNDLEIPPRRALHGTVQGCLPLLHHRYPPESGPLVTP